MSDLAGTSEGDDEITAKAKQALQARRESVVDSPLAPSNGKNQTAYIGKFTKILNFPQISWSFELIRPRIQYTLDRRNYSIFNSKIAAPAGQARGYIGADINSISVTKSHSKTEIFGRSLTKNLKERLLL